MLFKSLLCSSASHESNEKGHSYSGTTLVVEKAMDRSSIHNQCLSVRSRAEFSILHPAAGGIRSGTSFINNCVQPKQYKHNYLYNLKATLQNTGCVNSLVFKLEKKHFAYKWKTLAEIPTRNKGLSLTFLTLWKFSPVFFYGSKNEKLNSFDSQEGFLRGTLVLSKPKSQKKLEIYYKEFTHIPVLHLSNIYNLLKLWRTG